MAGIAYLSVLHYKPVFSSQRFKGGLITFSIVSNKVTKLILKLVLA